MTDDSIENESSAVLDKAGILNPENDKKEIRNFRYKPSKITAEYEDQTITWEFNSTRLNNQ